MNNGNNIVIKYLIHTYINIYLYNLATKLILPRPTQFNGAMMLHIMGRDEDGKVRLKHMRKSRKQ